MADTLQTQHWLDRAIALAKADAGIVAASFAVIEYADMFYFISADSQDTVVPAITVRPTVTSDVRPPDPSAKQFFFQTVLRVVGVWTFAIGTDSPWAIKAAGMGTIHAAFLAKAADRASSWIEPAGDYQFMHAIPGNVEWSPSEENALRTVTGSNNLVASAFSLPVQFKVTIS